jgi:hypothetical protein
MIDFENAACVNKYQDDQHQDIFFPEPGEGYAYAVAKAKLLCGQCPIALACFNFAMKEKYEGVWGNTTSRERESMRISPRVRQEHILVLTQQAIDLAKSN